MFNGLYVQIWCDIVKILKKKNSPQFFLIGLEEKANRVLEGHLTGFACRNNRPTDNPANGSNFALGYGGVATALAASSC